MLTLVKSDNRGKTKTDWLESYHSFSFGDFYDPENTQFGPIRVLNDDIVQPGTGFPKHPHNNMEIVTIILEGELAHEDSTGGKEVIHTGEIQRMTAGKGIFHSEYNNSNEQPTRLLQIWFFPNEAGLNPNYEQKKYDVEKSKNNLLKVVSGNEDAGTIYINQDAELFISNLEKGNSVSYEPSSGRGVYIYLPEGKLSVNETELNKGDALKIKEESSLEIAALTDSQFVLFDVALN